jgi:YD repeat-containing protein
MLFLLTSPAQAAPSDPFTGALPTKDQEAPDTTNYNVGDWGVSEQRGTAIHTYPIQVPPGRGNMAPQLALRYSSNSPLRGGIAAGWTLDLPLIEEDDAAGKLDTPRYRASMGAASGRLIEVPDANPYPNSTAYRVEFDESFTRFFYLAEAVEGVTWIALTTDGVRHEFAEVAQGNETYGIWRLVRQVDAFGNTINYHWGFWGDPNATHLELNRIDYSSNVRAELDSHAAIYLEYSQTPETCANSAVPIGAALHATGYIENPLRLASIVIQTKDGRGGQARVARRVKLQYEHMVPDGEVERISCNQPGAPLRYLRAIQEEAYDLNGLATTLPPVTFTYNQRQGQADAQLGVVIEAPGYDHAGSIHGAEVMLQDVDADGVQDRISVGGNSQCYLAWRKGLLGGGYETHSHVSLLPTADWLEGNQRTHFEACTLNGQLAYRYQEIIDGQKVPVQGLVAYHFMDYTGDGRLDLLTQVWAPGDHRSYVPPFSTMQSALAEPEQAVPGDGDPAPDVGNEIMTPFKDINGHVWLLYPGVAGKSHLLFDLTPSRIYGPGALPPTLESDKLDADSLPNISLPRLVDLDSDGYIDYFDVGSIVSNQAWKIHFGNGGQHFNDVQDWSHPMVQLGNGGGGSYETTNGDVTERATTVALRDINGDGLQDLLVLKSDGELAYYANIGRAFVLNEQAVGLQTPVDLQVTIYTGLDGGGNVIDGTRILARRMVDVDQDGLVDMLDLRAPGSDAQHTELAVHYNLGDRFMPAQQLPPVWGAAQRLLDATDGEWTMQADVMDGNGDGVLDLVFAKADGSQRQIHDIGFVTAPHLLATVENGRGLRTEYRYAPTSDRNVVQWDADSTHYLPSVQWVVVKQYRYTDPVMAALAPLAGEPEPHRFQGFRQVTTTTAPGDPVLAQQVVRNYIYGDTGTPDGRVREEWIYGSEATGFVPHQVIVNSWNRRPLFHGEVAFIHLSERLTIHCRKGQDAPGCLAQNDHVLRYRETWEPRDPSKEDPNGTHVVTSPAALYVRIQVQEGSGRSVGLLDRQTVTSYRIRYGQNAISAQDYRILPVEIETKAAVQKNGTIQFETHGRQKVDLNSSSGLPDTEHHWLDAQRVATTRYSYDPQTGNLLSKTKPEQAKVGGPSTVYTYDAYKLFVHTTTNELNHQVITEYDLATGAQKARRGPNQVTLVNGSQTWEAEEWTLDGFGRILTHAAMFSDATGKHQLRTIAKQTYFDFEQPTRVRSERLRDVGGTIWLTTDHTTDGLGRRLNEIVHLASPIEAVTSYSYSASGQLKAIALPDPRQDDGSTIVYRYESDSLGRLVQWVKPDNGSVVIQYDAGEKNIQEVNGTGVVETGSVKKQVYDIFGRMIEVHEFDRDGSAAITRYQYNVQNHLQRIENADGQVTTLEHDWLGNRTSVTRGSRVWSYEFDLNGNKTSDRVPVASGVDPALTTVAYRYDALDRVERVEYQEPALSSLLTAGSSTAQVASLVTDNPLTETLSAEPSGDASAVAAHALFLSAVVVGASAVPPPPQM